MMDSQFPSASYQTPPTDPASVLGGSGIPLLSSPGGTGLPTLQTAGSFISKIMKAIGRPGSGGVPGTGTSDSSPRIFLAGFGKHPGAEDHDDIGVETEQLSAIKRSLYTNGIAGSIDSGDWEKLAADEKIDQFGHEFLWERGPWLFCGRLWASRDAKGRSKYPMVVCSQTSGVSKSWVLSTIPPILHRLQEELLVARNRADAKGMVDHARAELREAAANPAISTNTTTSFAEDPAVGPYDYLASHADLGVGSRGLMNLLYGVEQEMVGFRKGDDQRSFTTIMRLSCHVRVPALGLNPIRSADLWIAAMRPLLHPGSSILAVRPIYHDWVDVIVGEPTKDEIYSLLANRKKLPLATDVPYAKAVEPSFVARVNSWVAGQRRGSASSRP